MSDINHTEFVSYLRSIASLDSDDIDAAIKYMRDYLNRIANKEFQKEVSDNFEMLVRSNLWGKKRNKIKAQKLFSEGLEEIADLIEKKYGSQITSIEKC